MLALVNAGHVAPYLLPWRRPSTPSQLPVNLPLGMFADTDYRSTDLDLEPGDRLVLVTDGMLERNAATLDLIAEIAATRALHPREATRRLTDKVLEACRAEPRRRRHPARPGLARRARARPGHGRRRGTPSRERCNAWAAARRGRAAAARSSG